MHTATKAQGEKRIAELEARVSRLTEQNKQLDMRRQMDLEGWVSDVTFLRRAVTSVDRKLLQMRLVERCALHVSEALHVSLNSAVQPHLQIFLLQ